MSMRSSLGHSILFTTWNPGLVPATPELLSLVFGKICLSVCVDHVVEWINPTKTLWSSVAAVVTLCCCLSYCAHRRHQRSRHIYQRWLNDEVTHNESGIIMLRYTASTTLFRTMSLLILSQLHYDSAALSGISCHLVYKCLHGTGPA